MTGQRTIDRYAELESIWISKPTYLSRRLPLEERLVTMSKEQLMALQMYIVYMVNSGFLNDYRTAKAIHTIIGEVLEDEE